MKTKIYLKMLLANFLTVIIIVLCAAIPDIIAKGAGFTVIFLYIEMILLIIFPFISLKIEKYIIKKYNIKWQLYSLCTYAGYIVAIAAEYLILSFINMHKIFPNGDDWAIFSLGYIYLASIAGLIFAAIVRFIHLNICIWRDEQ